MVLDRSESHSNRPPRLTVKPLQNSSSIQVHPPQRRSSRVPGSCTRRVDIFSARSLRVLACRKMTVHRYRFDAIGRTRTCKPPRNSAVPIGRSRPRRADNPGSQGAYFQFRHYRICFQRTLVTIYVTIVNFQASSSVTSSILSKSIPCTREHICSWHSVN